MVDRHRHRCFSCFINECPYLHRLARLAHSASQRDARSYVVPLYRNDEGPFSGTYHEVLGCVLSLEDDDSDDDDDDDIDGGHGTFPFECVDDEVPLKASSKSDTLAVGRGCWYPWSACR